MRASRFVLLGLLLSPFAATAANADDGAPTERDLRAAHVVWETIGLSPQKGRPGAELVEQVRTLCEGTDVYCYEGEHADGLSPGRERIRWSVKIDFAHGIPAGRGVPVDPAAGVAGRHDATGAVILYKENRTKRIPVSRVEFKALVDGVYLAMGVNRPLEAAAKEDAIERAPPRWEVFVEAARRNGLVGSQDEIVLVARRGDAAGRPLASGEVVSVRGDLSRPVRVPLEVSARPRSLPPGERYELAFDVRPEDRKVLRLSAPGLAPTATGYRLETTDETVQVLAQLVPEPKPPGFLPAGPVVSVGRVRIREGSRGKDLAVEAHDWWPVVTRLEVWQPQAESVRLLAGAPEPGAGDRRLGERLQFTERVRLEGALRDAWARFEPRVRTRPAGESFGSDEGVVMGWALDPDNEATFLAAVDETNESQKTRFVAGAEFRAEVDVRIVEAPKPRLGPDGEFDDDVGMDEIERQREIRRDVTVEDFGLEVRFVDDGGDDLRRAAQEKPLAEGRLLVYDPGHKRMSDYVPLSDEGRTDHQWMLRFPGTYELRLHMELTRGMGEERQTKKVDVAARFRVVKHGFDVRVLDWQLTRQK